MANYGNSNVKISDAISVAVVGGTPDSYPTHFAFLGKGGWRSAATLSDLNATSAKRVEDGCAGYVWNDGNNNGLYIYSSSSWVKTSLSTTAYTLPIATDTVLGGVKVPSNGPITINNSGELGARIATTSLLGVVKVGSGLAVANDGTLSVTAANLTVINESGSYSQSYGKLRFKGTAIQSVQEDSIAGENQVTINLPTASDGTTVGAFKNIVFNGTGGVGVTGAFNPTTGVYTLTLSITSSGTLKQHLYELDDVDATTVTTPSNGYILQFDTSSGKWKAVSFTPGSALTNLSAVAPLLYNSPTGAFSITQAGSTQNGYLSSVDWNTFNNKQVALVSGSNIKTINGLSILGSGNLVVGGTVTSVAALTIGTSGTDINSTVANSTTTPVITLNIPTANSTNRGVITPDDYITFSTVATKLNIQANTNTGSGTTVNIGFSQSDTIFGSVGSPVTGNLTTSFTSAKVGVTHIIIHQSSTVPTITGASKLSGSGNYKINVLNYIYITYVGSNTAIYSINQTV